MMSNTNINLPGSVLGGNGQPKSVPYGIERTQYGVWTMNNNQRVYSNPSNINDTSGVTNDNSGTFDGNSSDNAASTPSLVSATNTRPNSSKSLVAALSSVGGKDTKTKLNPSFYSHTMKLESWANVIGVNLLAQKYKLDSKGRWRAVPHSPVLIYSIRAFLAICLCRELFGEWLVDATDEQLMLYIGDFSNIYGVHVDRFAFNAFKFCWGLHAFIVYWWITKNNGKIRTWLVNFENRWLETSYYVNKDLELESLQKMRFNRKFVTATVHITTVIVTITITGLNGYGYVIDSKKSNIWTNTSTVVYFIWCAVNTTWFWFTFVINMTAFGHHYLLCRAIHIRFDETKKDLEYALLSEWNINTKPKHISGLITKHYYVCDMVKQANKHLKIYLFIMYIIFTPHLCLMIYEIIFSTTSTTQGRFFIGFLLVVSDLFQVYLVSVLSAQITSKSHEPYYAMHGVNNFEDFPENIQLQTTLFMQRISNTVVGLTILDSFVLTGGLISSLVTAIVTYFSVIFESV